MFSKYLYVKSLAKKFNDMSNTIGKFHPRTIVTGIDYPVPTLSPIIIKEKLKKENVSFIDGYTCFHLQECTMCSPLKKSSSNRSTVMLINKQTGFFVCELCKCAGTWNIFERLLQQSKKGSEKTAKEITSLRDGLSCYYEKGQQSWKKIIEDSVAVHELSAEEYSYVLKSFSFHEVPKAILEKMNLFVSKDRNTLYLPLFSFTQFILGYIVYDKAKGQYTFPKRNCAGFLHLPHKKKQNSSVIVSNLQDFFALAASNIQYNLICLPHGVTNLPQIILPFLEQFESLILWLGLVPGAWDASRNFSKKLNEKRCFLIRGSENQISPTVAITNSEDIRKILSDARPTWHQAITTFASLRVDVLQEIRNHEEVLGVRWTRFPVLNKTLRGLRRGELTVLTGPTGAGKTTFMAEYSLDLAMQGVNTLWGSFEVRNVRLARTMLQQFAGHSLEDNLPLFDTMADEFERLPLYYLTFHGQASVRTVMDAVEHAAYIHDIAHVIIDNVQFMIGMSENNKYHDKFHKQDLIIHAFRTFATRCNVHVTLVIHPRKERESDDLTANSIFGGAKAAQEADNVLIIQDKRLTNVKGKKYLQVAKNRYTGDLGIMTLDFDKTSLSFSPSRKKNNKEITHAIDSTIFSEANKL